MPAGKKHLLRPGLVCFFLLCLFYLTGGLSPAALAKQVDDFYAEAVRSAIKDLEQSPDNEKRAAAAELLGYHATEASINALGRALVGDRDPKVRNKAADSLWKLGKKATAAQESLFAALKDDHPGVKTAASWALQVQGVDPGKLAEARRSALADEQSGVIVLFWAAKGLIGFAPPAELVGPILAYTKTSIRSDPAESAVKKLTASQDRNLIPVMTEMVGEYHRGNAIILSGLEVFHPAVAGLVSLICRQLTYEDNELKAAALQLLENHVEQSGEVDTWLPFVKPLTSYPDLAVRSQALRVIARAGGLAYDALPEVVRVLGSETESSVRQGAVEAVAAMGDRARPFPDRVKEGVAAKAVPELTRLIRTDPDRQVRMSAVRALDKLKTDPGLVVPVFTAAALNDEHSLVRMASLQALRDRGGDARSAVPDLRKLLEHPDASTSQNAKWAIEAIEKGEKPIGRSLAAQEGGGQQQAMASLREQGAGFDERGLMLALSSFNLDKVKAYLDSGVPVNYRLASVYDKPLLSAVFDNTAMYAMLKKPTPPEVKELVRFLLDRGADPNLADKQGNTALMMASMGCDAELLQMLIDRGADPNAISKDGITAIEYTISFANQGAEALIKAGAKIPPDKVQSYKEAYGANPAALDIIERAAAP